MKYSIRISFIVFLIDYKSSIASLRATPKFNFNLDVGNINHLLLHSQRFQVPSRLYSSLTHVDEHGRARMVDVGEKKVTSRLAVAEGSVHVGQKIIKLIEKNEIKKGDVLSIAQISGILGAKRTAELIPLCHNIPLTSVKVELKLNKLLNDVEISAAVKCDGKTGVEMEALMAVSLAALTIYDMCKAVSHKMVIKDIRLIKKTGGKSDYNEPIIQLNYKQTDDQSKMIKEPFYPLHI